MIWTSLLADTIAEMPLCAHYAGPAQLGDHLAFECQHAEKVRFVKLMIRGIEILHVAEVNVYALEDSRFGEIV